MNNSVIGFAFTGSFCTLRRAVDSMKRLVELGYSVVPIMSRTTYETDTRFGRAEDFIKEIEGKCRRKIWYEITEVEPIGPKKLLDLLVIAPCTGNTLAKMAYGVTDTSVAMAAKSQLRNARPVLIAPSTNDGLSASAKNIGMLMNNKNIFFVPYEQDDPENKCTSLVCLFDLIPKAVEAALEGKQLQPVIR
ncbi:MAG: dipicolinate synthase subunit B [Clostridia bacterium]|nr:dipicolinate synthase subunit B [Clostridia bacterium]